MAPEVNFKIEGLRNLSFNHRYFALTSYFSVILLWQDHSLLYSGRFLSIQDESNSKLAGKARRVICINRLFTLWKWIIPFAHGKIFMRMVELKKSFYYSWIWIFHIPPLPQIFAQCWFSIGPVKFSTPPVTNPVCNSTVICVSDCRDLLYKFTSFDDLLPMIWPIWNFHLAKKNTIL